MPFKVSKVVNGGQEGGGCCAIKGGRQLQPSREQAVRYGRGGAQGRVRRAGGGRDEGLGVRRGGGGQGRGFRDRVYGGKGGEGKEAAGVDQVVG